MRFSDVPLSMESVGYFEDDEVLGDRAASVCPRGRSINTSPLFVDCFRRRAGKSNDICCFEGQEILGEIEQWDWDPILKLALLSIRFVNIWQREFGT